MALFTATRSPEISPRQYARIRNTERPKVTISEVIESRSVFFMLPESGSEKIAIHSEIIQVGIYKRATGDWLPNYHSKLAMLIKLWAFIYDKRLPNMVMVVDASKYLSNSLVYYGRSRIYVLKL